MPLKLWRIITTTYQPPTTIKSLTEFIQHHSAQPNTFVCEREPHILDIDALPLPSSDSEQYSM
jgi:hypothetical protein